MVIEAAIGLLRWVVAPVVLVRLAGSIPVCAAHMGAPRFEPCSVSKLATGVAVLAVSASGLLR